MSVHTESHLLLVIPLKIDFLPFALSLSKGERPVHGSTISPLTGISPPLWEIIFSGFVVSIANAQDRFLLSQESRPVDSRLRGNDTQ